MKVWLNNEMILGIQAAPDFRMIGLDYPVGASNEHLYDIRLVPLSAPASSHHLARTLNV